MDPPLIKGFRSNTKGDILTLGFSFGCSWHYCHGDVNNKIPEGNKRHKVVELILAIHDKAQKEYKEIVPKNHLQN